MGRMKNILRHLSSFIAPIVIGFLLPYLLVRWESGLLTHSTLTIPIVLRVIGLVIGGGGMTLLLLTIQMFIRIGKGTIMPWDPTRKLIVVGPYAHVRNPMISSVLILLVGEAIFFASIGVVLLAGFFFVLNTVYFIFSEEPGLVKRFGAEYMDYKQNVPRWIPRLKPWRPT